MWGYGLPRNHDVGSPDCADIRMYGLNIGRFKNAEVKANTRRVWKKREHRAQKNAIRLELLSLNKL